MNYSANTDLFEQYQLGVEKDEKYFENYFDYINDLSNSPTFVFDENEITFPSFIASFLNDESILDASINEMYYDINDDSEIIFESDEEAYFPLYDELIRNISERLWLF